MAAWMVPAVLHKIRLAERYSDVLPMIKELDFCSAKTHYLDSLKFGNEGVLAIREVVLLLPSPVYT